jgi:hypothetical protein
MKKNHLYSVLIVFAFLVGFDAVCREGVATTKDNNTAVRVLLDKAIPKGKVASLLFSTFYRSKPERGWINAEKELEISVGLSKKKPVLINSRPFQDSFVFIRGGTNASDKLIFLENFWYIIPATIKPNPKLIIAMILTIILNAQISYR